MFDDERVFRVPLAEQEKAFRLAMVQAHPDHVQKALMARGVVPPRLRKAKAQRDAVRMNPVPHYRLHAEVVPVEPSVPEQVEEAEVYIPVAFKNSADVWLKGRKRVKQIALAIAKKYGLTLNELLGNRRGEQVVTARQHAIWMVAKETGMTLTQIGRFFKRDHTTVLYSIKRHEQRLQEGAV